jgi:hypothetical protein
MNVSAELVERALQRLKVGPAKYGVAAVMIGEITEPDRDGRRWRLVVTDGSVVDTLIGHIPASKAGADVSDDELVRRVERRAGNFAVERAACAICSRSLRWISRSSTDGSGAGAAAVIRRTVAVSPARPAADYPGCDCARPARLPLTSPRKGESGTSRGIATSSGVGGGPSVTRASRGLQPVRDPRRRPHSGAATPTASAVRRLQDEALGAARGQLAEHDPHRVGGVQLVVAVGGDNQRRQRVGAPGDELQDVERGLVGPVEVLEDEDRGAAAQL